jgi:hypothetical protein
MQQAQHFHYHLRSSDSPSPGQFFVSFDDDEDKRFIAEVESILAGYPRTLDKLREDLWADERVQSDIDIAWARLPDGLFLELHTLLKSPLDAQERADATVARRKAEKPVYFALACLRARVSRAEQARVPKPQTSTGTVADPVSVWGKGPKK